MKWFGGKYNGIYSGMRYYCYPSLSVHDLSESITGIRVNIREVLQLYFLAPSFLTSQTGGVGY